MRVPATVLGLTAAAVLIAVPAAPASARGWHHGHGGGLFFPLAVAGAVVGAAATIATAPVRILADAAAGPAYAPAPAYAAPPPAYYAPQPQAYAPQPQAYAPPPQAYYPPPQQAYYPPPAYYYPPR